MEAITRTNSGTLVTGGAETIEYNEYPPPPLLVKAMQRRWAEPLVRDGSMRLGSLGSYQRWENQELGDPNDGEGLLRMDGHPYPTGSGNPVFAWCMAYPQISGERLCVLAKAGGYDCVVRISSPEELFRRVRRSLRKAGANLWLHCGAVTYNREQEVDKATLNSQPFRFNVFQKDARFQEDREYRLSVTDCGFAFREKDSLDLTLGDCRDIMELEELPDLP